MFQRLLHVLYVIEFLIALIAIYTVWSEVGGQGHLDYMAWYWLAAIGLPAAFAVVRLTMAFSSEGRKRLRLIGWTLLLVLLAVGAGLVTYYTHLNEPKDEDEQDQGTVTPAALHSCRVAPRGIRRSLCRHPVCRRGSLPAVPSRGVRGAIGVRPRPVAGPVPRAATG